MHIEEIAHAMTCTVTVIAMRLPERFAADGINHRAFDVFGENGFRQRNMRFQDQSVIALHGRTRIADRHHARDVGRTAPVLPPESISSIPSPLILLLFSGVAL